jgi:hypothetical protein
MTGLIDEAWQPMDTAPHGVAILARGWDYGKEGNGRHYSIVIYDNNRWLGVGNDTTWEYLTDWRSL